MNRSGPDPELALAVLQASPAATLLTTIDGEILHANQAAVALLGMDLDQMRRLGFDGLSPDTAQARRVLQLAAGGQAGAEAHRMLRLRRSGGEFWAEVGLAATGRDEAPLCLTLRDVTRQVQVEQRLASDEQRLRLLGQNMPVLLEVLSRDKVITYWNREAEQVTGYKADEVVNNPDILRRMYPDDAYRARLLRSIGTRGSDFRDVEWDITCKDGTVRTIAWFNVSRQFPIEGWFSWAIGVDMTGRKASEQALRRSRQRFASTFEHAAAGMAILDTQGRVTRANAFLGRMLGREPDGLQGLDLAGLTHEEDRPMLHRRLEQALGGELDHFWLELRLLGHGGGPIWVFLSGALVRDQEGLPVQFVAHFQDLTQGKRSEEALWEANTALKVLLRTREEEKQQMAHDAAAHVENLVTPYLQRLRATPLDARQITLLDIAATNLEQLAAPGSDHVSRMARLLTPTEMEVARLIRAQHTSQEIAEALHVSPAAVSFHRANIRRKLGLKSRRENLRSHLQAMA